ncbi:MAG: SMC family ATPase [Chloroflexota bacterium]
MIPLRLKMRNFMCYRGDIPPLDLSGVHTAVISGDNGSGKSALIDAMTWALWGVSRAGDHRNHDSLVTLGENEMMVDFEFAVGSQRYRVVRKYARPKRAGGAGQSDLQFQIAVNGGYRPLSGERIDQTESKIAQTLHLDYETFVSSALLLQGKADEFTVKRPAERIQVLANIMGLGEYDELADAARSEANSLANEVTRLEASLREIAQELTRESEVEIELTRIEGELKDLSAVITQKETALAGLRRQVDALNSKERELSELGVRLRDAEENRERWASQINQLKRRLGEYEALLSRRPEIEENYGRLTEAKKLDNELSQKFRNLQSLKDRRNSLEQRITALGQELTREHDRIQMKIDELKEKRDELLGLRLKREQLGKEVAGLSAEEERLLRQRQANEALREEIAGLRAGESQLTAEISDIDEKMKLLTTGGANCPLCETELGATGIELVRQKFLTDKELKSRKLTASQAEATAKSTRLQASEKEAASLENKLKAGHSSLQGKLSVIEKSISEAQEAGVALDGFRQDLAHIEDSMALKDYARSEQQALLLVEKQISELDYNETRHGEVRSQLTTLEPYAEQKVRLDEAVRREAEARSDLIHAEEAHHELVSHIEADNRKKEALGREIAGLPELSSALAQAEKESASLKLRQGEFQKKLGEVEGQAKRLGELRLKKLEQEKNLTRLSGEAQNYRELAEAFGKKGIQTMLIELALPELENEANRLLARMTDNRMHLKFETQRLGRTRGTIDTLDINIADELGTREYGMYSGGEAFRINFALRIALARLLAQRAGAPLPTLIIDEGFGTQDSGGIEKIKEAISSIQDDFEKILVITHIEELRDAFPTRINVVKTPAGSTIEAG